MTAKACIGIIAYETVGFVPVDIVPIWTFEVWHLGARWGTVQAAGHTVDEAMETVRKEMDQKYVIRQAGQTPDMDLDPSYTLLVVPAPNESRN